MCEAVRGCSNDVEYITYKGKGACFDCWSLHCNDDSEFNLTEHYWSSKKQLSAFKKKANKAATKRRKAERDARRKDTLLQRTGMDNGNEHVRHGEGVPPEDGTTMPDFATLDTPGENGIEAVPDSGGTGGTSGSDNERGHSKDSRCVRRSQVRNGRVCRRNGTPIRHDLSHDSHVQYDETRARRPII
jgi:hypothetical protein